MTNPYKSNDLPKPTGDNMNELPRSSGRLDRVAYRFLSVGYFLTIIGIILLAILSPFVLYATMTMGGSIGAPGPIEVLFIMIQGFFTVLYVGITWASLRTLRIAAKKHCVECV